MCVSYICAYQCSPSFGIGVFTTCRSAELQSKSNKVSNDISYQFYITYLQSLMAIHCCAMQGRIDAIQLLLKHDKSDSIRNALESEDSSSPPSLIHLAVANDELSCAKWLAVHILYIYIYILYLM